MGINKRAKSEFIRCPSKMAIYNRQVLVASCSIDRWDIHKSVQFKAKSRGTVAIPMEIPIENPMGIPLGLPTGIPMGITTGIPMGIPMGLQPPILKGLTASAADPAKW